MKTKNIKIFEDYEPIECIQVNKDCGDIMPVGEFVDCCISNALTDYDGYAHFIITQKENNEFVDYELPFCYKIDDDDVFFINAIDESKTDIGSLMYVCMSLGIKKIIWYNK